PIRADHGDALALFERGLQRLLLPAGDLRLDGEGPVIELTELARLPLELSLGVVARLHRQRAALLLEFGDEVARQAGEAEDLPPLRDGLHLRFQLRDRIAEVAQLLVGKSHADDAREQL